MNARTLDKRAAARLAQRVLGPDAGAYCYKRAAYFVTWGDYSGDHGAGYAAALNVLLGDLLHPHNNVEPASLWRVRRLAAALNARGILWEQHRGLVAAAGECGWCSGAGVDPVGMPGEPCPVCRGTGRQPAPQPRMEGFSREAEGLYRVAVTFAGFDPKELMLEVHRRAPHRATVTTVEQAMGAVANRSPEYRAARERERANAGRER